MKILVIPTIRQNCFLNFKEAWKDLGDWDRMIIVEDHPEKTFDAGTEYHYSWKEIAELVGPKNAWIFSRRDSAIRSFGFLAAARMNAKYILTLDDDCYPAAKEPIFQSHIDAMQHKRWISTVPDLVPRGLPYKSTGIMHTKANMGLWTNVPDQDAIHALINPISNYQPPTHNWVVPKNQYIPLCGMNYCFTSELIPLSYFPLMGIESPYRRFDDIWHGIILKKVCDHLDYQISVGGPSVKHLRASDPFNNLMKEAPGVQANETFWETIDSINLSGTTPTECMAEIGKNLEHNEDGYLSKLGIAIGIWLSLIVQLDSRNPL